MACYSPLSAWQTDSGQIVFAERGAIRRSLVLPCGQCIGCRLERSRQWAVRCVHERQMHEYNSFVTLTFDDDHMPDGHSLDHSYFQKFCKRTRKKLGPFRFFMCGEYGEMLQRPHFHACIFGLYFGDRRLIRDSDGMRLYESKTLNELWPFGYASVGDVTFQSAAYVASYCTKKVTGKAASDHYMVVDSDTGEVFWREPEYARMSLKPGIGASWFSRYSREVYPHDRVVIDGRVQKPPRFYDKMLESLDSFRFDAVSLERFKRSVEFRSDATPERLRVREVVAKARLSNKVRSL